MEMWLGVGQGAMLTRLDFACDAKESSQGLDNRMTQSNLKSYPGICKSISQNFSEVDSAGVFLQLPREHKDLPRVTQQAEEGFELRSSHPKILPPFSSHVLPRLLTSRSAPHPLNFSPLSTSETVWATYRPHPSRIQEYSCPEVWNSPGCPWRLDTACPVPGCCGDL